MANSDEPEPTHDGPQPKRRFALRFPANYDELTEDEKMAVAMGMAKALQKALGYPKEPPEDDPDTP